MSGGETACPDPSSDLVDAEAGAGGECQALWIIRAKWPTGRVVLLGMWTQSPCRAQSGKSGRGVTLKAEYLNPSVLPEVVVECERPRHASGVKDGERDRVTQGPVLVGVPR